MSQPFFSFQALTTMRMEFEALEDEAHAIHGDLWEQLNAGGQVNNGFSEMFLLPRSEE